MYVLYRVLKIKRHKLRHYVGKPKLNTPSRVPKRSKLLSFPDADVYRFDLGLNFLTFAYLKNVNCKRDVTFKSCNTGCFGGFESVHAVTYRRQHGSFVK